MAGLTLDTLPDDALQQVVAAFGGTAGDALPVFGTVNALGCLSKALLQQLHRLRPLVSTGSLAVVQRPSRGPWRTLLLYRGLLTAEVMDQASRGRVRSISVIIGIGAGWFPARRVVPELLGAGCSLLDLNLSNLYLGGTWAATFGKAAVASAVLRTLRLRGCQLQGPLPELRLPALQWLDLSRNELEGGLEPLQGCTALQMLFLERNHLTGELAPLRGLAALKELLLSSNNLTGSLEPLRGCAALRKLYLGSIFTDEHHRNRLTGGLAPLIGCRLLRSLHLEGTQLVPTDDELCHFQEQCHFLECRT